VSKWLPNEKKDLEQGWSKEWPKRMQISACPQCDHNGAFDDVLVDQTSPIPGGQFGTHWGDVRTTETREPGEGLSGFVVACHCRNSQHGEGAVGCGRVGYVAFG